MKLLKIKLNHTLKEMLPIQGTYNVYVHPVRQSTCDNAYQCITYNPCSMCCKDISTNKYKLYAKYEYGFCI